MQIFSVICSRPLMGMMSGSPSVPFKTSARRNVPSALPYSTWNNPAMSCSMREYDPERMSRWPSPSMSTNCGVELVHHHTPGTSATWPSALQPGALRELPLAQVLEDPDLSLMELPDEKVLLAVAVDVGPARRRVARAFNTDGHAARFQTHRTFEFRQRCTRQRRRRARLLRIGVASSKWLRCKEWNRKFPYPITKLTSLPGTTTTLRIVLPSSRAAIRSSPRAAASMLRGIGVGGNDDAAPQLAVDLDRDLDLVVLQQRRVVGGPGLVGQGLGRGPGSARAPRRRAEPAERGAA